MSVDAKLTPFRPYMVQAMYNWIVDNNLTPQISVNVNCPNIDLPLQYAQNGIIVLNIGPIAVRDFAMDHDAISFTARFGGVPHMVYVPMQAIIAIYPREDISLGVSMYPEKAYDEEESSISKASTKESEQPTRSGVTLEVIDSQSDTSRKDGCSQSSSKASSSHKPSLELVE